MKAISVRQPWAWLLVNGHKDIENRTWQNSYRGQLLIHAGKGMTDTEYLDVLRFLASKDRLKHLAEILPAPPELERGGIVGIVGRVDVIGCFAEHASPWFMGPYGFLVRNQTTLPFRPYVGMLGLFEVPDTPAEPGEDVQPSLL